jgi:hypothetical protein
MNAFCAPIFALEKAMFWGLSIFNPHLSQSDWDGDIIPR